MPSFSSSYPSPVTAYPSGNAEKKALREETADTAAGIVLVHKRYEENKKASYFVEKKKRALELKRGELEKSHTEMTLKLATVSREVEATEEEVKSLRQEKEWLRGESLKLRQRQGTRNQVLPRATPEIGP